MPNCFWRDDPAVTSHDLLTVNGQHTSITEIQTVIRDLINDCEDRLLKLIGNLDLLPPLAQVHDRLGSSSLGYSAMSDPRNHTLSKASGALFTKAVTDPLLSRQVLGSDSRPIHRGPRSDNKDLRWDHEVVGSLMVYCDNILRLLSVAAHMTYGSPARGTELLTVKLSNNKEGLRGWYVVGGRVVLVCRWQKTSGLEGGKDTMIPRVLDASVSKLFLRYCAYVRPFQGSEGRVFKAVGLDEGHRVGVRGIFQGRHRAGGLEAARLLSARLLLHQASSRFRQGIRRFGAILRSFFQRPLLLVQQGR
ncbi:hypothetical protein M231_03805 [Tremella mesenterica]|uniref:Uncharacterized protein n=1 Tax=Tremella mesenterica TaxID=5217 RepID=A0A4Q1BMK5_TREME|nr:hypothetical protein M231_03805 [Tremella mesenterica]